MSLDPHSALLIFQTLSPAYKSILNCFWKTQFDPDFGVLFPELPHPPPNPPLPTTTSCFRQDGHAPKKKCTVIERIVLIDHPRSKKKYCQIWCQQTNKLYFERSSLVLFTVLCLQALSISLSRKMFSLIAWT